MHRSGYRDGNVKRASRFICLRCLEENCVGQGIQRPNTKEIDHIKDISCLCVKMKYETKNLEVRWCDDFRECMERAQEIQGRYYDSNGNQIMYPMEKGCY